MTIKKVSVGTTTNITSTTFTDLLSKNYTTTLSGLKSEFTASVSAEYFSTVKFRLLIDDEPVASCAETVNDDGFASVAMQAIVELAPGTHTIKVQAAKAESANATITIDPSANDHATLILQEVDFESDEAFSEFALSFDGSDDYIVATGYKGVTGTSARSFSWWYKTDTVAGYNCVLSYGAVAAYAPWTILMPSVSGPAITLQTYSDQVGWLEADNGDLSNVDDENWHHYVMTAPVSGTLADVKVFMDGVEQTGQQELNGDDANIFDTGNTYDLRIGARPFDGPVPTLGQLDEIAVFSSELTSAEVVAIYNSGAGLDLTEDAGDYESSANLELYYKLEEGTGTTAVDSSGNSRNGAITGGTWVAGF